MGSYVSKYWQGNLKICKNIEGIAHKRGHKNLKEIIAPSSFAFASHGDIKQ